MPPNRGDNPLQALELLGTWELSVLSSSAGHVQANRQQIMRRG